VIELRLLPACDGDCLLLSFGSGALTNRILIDGGRAATYRLIRPMLARAGVIDLLVVTHIDQDHILGVVAMLEEQERPARFGDIWFNGYDQLREVGTEVFGAREGERLTSALLAQDLPWNRAFSGHAVRWGCPAVRVGGAALTILSPDRDQLSALIPVWEKECAREGLITGRKAKEPPHGYEQFGPVDISGLADDKFVPDPSKTNRASIGFLFEYEGIRLIFTGDGDDTRLRTSLRALAEAEGGRFRADALKVSHHGSRGNLSRETLEILECATYIISTDGSRHQHPDNTTMARILKYGATPKEIAFNYIAPASCWRMPEWQTAYGYTLRCPEPARDGHLTLTW
jgi:beta-lactamase superfamily II metal-dependent hydrolase